MLLRRPLFKRLTGTWVQYPTHHQISEAEQTKQEQLRSSIGTLADPRALVNAGITTNAISYNWHMD
jgi:hypothetical protein